MLHVLLFCKIFPPFFPFPPPVLFLSFSSDCKIFRYGTLTYASPAHSLGQSGKLLDTLTLPVRGRLTHPKLHPSHNAGPRASLRSSQHLRPARTPVRIRIRAGSSVASEPPLAVCIPQSAHVMAEIAPLCWRARSLAPLFPPPKSSQKTGIQCIFVARRAAAASCLSAPSWSDCPPPQPPCWDPARPPFGDAVAQSTPL